MKCDKKSYAKKKDAVYSAKVREIELKHKLYVYKCSKCGFYHLSKMSPLIFKVFVKK